MQRHGQGPGLPPRRWTCYVVLCLAAGVLQPARGDVCDAPCQRRQQAELQSLYNATGGSTWLASGGWRPGADTGAPAGSSNSSEHCGWQGVACCLASGTMRFSQGSLYALPCSTVGAVGGLVLPLNNLTGRLADSSLPALAATLAYVDLHGNALTGPMPPFLSQASNLTFLNLEANSLSGTVPAWLFALPRLVVLSMGANSLSGTLPRSLLAGAPSLRVLSAPRNRLGGPLPRDWLALTLLFLEYNQLTGGIPAPPPGVLAAAAQETVRSGLGQIARLRGNRLSGPLPPGGAMALLNTLDVGHNNLSGNALALLTYMPLLEVFRIDNNAFNGSWPSTVSSFHIKVIDVASNQLTGTLPPSLGKQASLRDLNLDNNNFSGPLPEALSGCWGLELLSAVHSGLHGGTNSNARGERLPGWLQHATTGGLETFAGANNSTLLCVDTAPSADAVAPLTDLRLSPDYYDYEMCKCAEGFHAQWAGGVLRCSAAPGGKERTVALLIAVPTAVVAALLLLAAFYFARNNFASYQAHWAKKRGPPEISRPITLVSTDVEGSTELWEWQREAMAEATDIHDRILRSQLAKYHGYEVTTEGDAFLVAFHEPQDAVLWAVSVQQALLVARWPLELQYHPRTCIRLASDASAHHRASRTGSPKMPPPLFHDASDVGVSAISALHASHAMRSVTVQGGPDVRRPDAEHSDLEAQLPEHDAHDGFRELSEVDPRDVCFRGFAVRMAIATGKADRRNTHALSNRVEYDGPVMDCVRAVIDAPSGGQILVDVTTFQAINSVLVDLSTRLPPHPDYAALQAQVRTQPRAHSVHSATMLAAFERKGRLKNAPGCSLAELHGLTGPGDGVPASESSLHSVLNGHDARTRSSLMAHPEGHEALQAMQAAQAAHQPWWQRSLRRLHRSSARSAADGHQHSLMVVDMGIHVLKGFDQPLHLHQVMPPGLEERARLLAPLSSQQQTSPGYFDAPAAMAASLVTGTRAHTAAHLPDVTLVFCTIEDLKSIRAAGDAIAEQCLILYRSVVRQHLRLTDGYECQEADGAFMLAFKRPMAALHFCILVQENLLDEVQWGVNVTALAPCRAVVDDKQSIIFQGPRVKMGIYEGVPTRVVPHTTTGRADYFGPLVNRAARFCNAAARGGQVVAPLELAAKLVREWTGAECPPLPEAGHVTYLQAFGMLHDHGRFRPASQAHTIAASSGVDDAALAIARLAVTYSRRGSRDLSVGVTPRPAAGAFSRGPSAPASRGGSRKASLETGMAVQQLAELIASGALGSGGGALPFPPPWETEDGGLARLSTGKRSSTGSVALTRLSGKRSSAGLDEVGATTIGHGVPLAHLRTSSGGGGGGLSGAAFQPMQSASGADSGSAAPCLPPQTAAVGAGTPGAADATLAPRQGRRLSELAGLAEEVLASQLSGSSLRSAGSGTSGRASRAAARQAGLSGLSDSARSSLDARVDSVGTARGSKRVSEVYSSHNDIAISVGTSDAAVAWPGPVAEAIEEGDSRPPSPSPARASPSSPPQAPGGSGRAALPFPSSSMPAAPHMPHGKLWASRPPSLHLPGDAAPAALPQAGAVHQPSTVEAGAYAAGPLPPSAAVHPLSPFRRVASRRFASLAQPLTPSRLAPILPQRSMSSAHILPFAQGPAGAAGPLLSPPTPLAFAGGSLTPLLGPRASGSGGGLDTSSSALPSPMACDSPTGTSRGSGTSRRSLDTPRPPRAMRQHAARQADADASLLAAAARGACLQRAKSMPASGLAKLISPALLQLAAEQGGVSDSIMVQAAASPRGDPAGGPPRSAWRSARRRSSATATRRGSSASVSEFGVAQAALGDDPWAHVDRVEIRHVGQMRFKGVVGVQSVVQLSSGRLASRTFAAGPASAKAELVAPARGLAYVVMLATEAEEALAELMSPRREYTPRRL